MSNIPPKVRRKLAAIVKHQREVCRLVAECQTELGIDDVIDDECLWSWGMWINQQGAPTSVDDAVHWAEKYMRIKAAAAKSGAPTH